MKKKAFTLIELLAVIILLGIIAMLVYPSVNDTLTDSKKQAFKLSVTGIFNSVESDNASSDFAIDSKYVYNNGILTKVKENGRMLDSSVVVKTEGKLTDGNGTIVIDNEGNIIVKIDNQKWCGYNDKTNKNIEIMDGTCEGLTNPDNITPEYCFNFNKITGTITGYNYDGDKCTTDVVIPNIIDDVVVKYIGYAAFVYEITYQNCYDYEWNEYEEDPTYIHHEGDDYQYCNIEANMDNSITSIVLPQNIVMIGDWAFGYNRLTEITLNNLPNLTTIGQSAFEDNQIIELQLTNLPQLIAIDRGAFYENQLRNLTLSNLPNLTTIDDEAFGQNELTELNLNALSNLTTIGVGAFYANNIETLVLNNLPNLTIIDTSAFEGNQLTELNITNLPSLTKIGRKAFTYNQLTKLTLSNLPELVTIDKHSFTINNLENLTLNNLPNLTTIAEGAFGLNELTELVISDFPELVTIGSWTFYSNFLTKLTVTNLPKLKVIEEYAFYDNDITTLVMNTLPELTTLSEGVLCVNKLNVLTITNFPKLTTIGEWAFADNHLTEITLSNLPELITIDEGAFWKNSEEESNLNLSKIINSTNQSFDWSNITGADTVGQIFETGTITHQEGNIQVVAQ